MKFYSDQTGPLSVWDGEKVIPFRDGVLETTDAVLISRLKERYRHDEPKATVKTKPEPEPIHIPSPYDPPTMTRKELMAALDQMGVDYTTRTKRDELADLLAEAML